MKLDTPVSSPLEIRSATWIDLGLYIASILNCPERAVNFTTFSNFNFNFINKESDTNIRSVFPITGMSI